MSERLRVAILGATGHVGKCLAAGLLAAPAATPETQLTLVARDLNRLDRFVSTLPQAAEHRRLRMTTFGDFPAGEYDAIVNCVGWGDPAKLAAAPVGSIVELTERFDGLCLDYLARSPEARYISFSSGAAYGGSFDEPASDDSRSAFPVNNLTAPDFYGLAKLASEARHRARSDRAIVDLRLFGLFTRYIDPEARYFMNDVVRGIAAGESLLVGQDDVKRDYVDPADLTSLVLGALRSAPANDVFDVYSAAPVSKFEILADFSQRYGLDYDVDEDRGDDSPTGVKLNYYSASRRATRVGYSPSRTSLETLRAETDALLKTHGGSQND